MAATTHLCEDNGAATGSPAHGTTRHGFGGNTDYALNCNWKTADNSGASETAASAAQIGKPDCSYEKWQYVKFTGTFSRISNAKWTPHHNVFTDFCGAGIFLMGAVLSAYTTPSRTANANLTTDFTKGVYAYQGLPVGFSTTGPEDASPTTELTAAGYTQYLVSQTQVPTSVATSFSGQTNGMTWILTYDEE